MKRFSIFSRPVLLSLILSFAAIGPSLLADGGANHQVRNMNFGVSGGNVGDITRRFCCSGTLGSLLTDGTTQYILSNNHVLGLSGQAKVGDDVSQPGLIDNNCRVATVVADFTVAPSLSSNVDAAIAELRSGTMASTGFIEDIGTISSVVRSPSVGLSVAKSGRTTGFTTGTIGSINTTVNIQYPKKCGSGGGKVFTFTNQVVINSSTFSAGGDSGSLIVTNDACHQPVALLFAGSSTSTVGNPAGDVISQVGASLGSGVSFVGDNCDISAISVALAGPSQDAVRRAISAKERRETDLLFRPSVLGVGVGVSDTDSSETVIVVYVDKALSQRARLPRQIDGFRVKVIPTDKFVAY